MEELQKLQDLELQRSILIHVRDVFLFQCYTGLSYGDVKRLKSSNIQITSSNEGWVGMEREKTKIVFSVSLDNFKLMFLLM